MKPRFTNPWTLPGAAESETAPRRTGTSSPGEGRIAPETFDEGTGALVVPPSTVLQVPSYGGVTVKAAATATEAFLKILDALWPVLPQVDALLVSYGVLLTESDAAPVAGFFVYRNDDHRLFGVPTATTRAQAYLQITQALLEIARGPHRAVLERAGISPYRQ